MTAHLLKGMATPQRLRWLFTDHPIYFITACTYNRRQILAQPAVHNSFIEFGFRACEYRVWVGHYVIMPDHIHLFAGFGTRIDYRIGLDEVLEKCDLEDPQKRDFSRPALAERLLRSCHSLSGVL